MAEDVTKVSTSELLTAAKASIGDVDGIIGGPPCQGFSVSGKRLIDDPRNVLMGSGILSMIII